MTLVAAGYIVADDEGIIHGYGATAGAAWADMLRTMEEAHITLLDDDEDGTDQLGSWTRRSGFKTLPATAELISQVEARGGAIGWDRADGVATVPNQKETLNDGL